MKKSKKEHSDKHLFSAVFVYITSQKWPTVVEGFVAVFIPIPYSLVFPGQAHQQLTFNQVN